MDDSRPPESLGVWFVGARGSIATMTMLCVRLLSRSAIAPVGVLTEREPYASLPFCPLSALRFGGVDLRDVPLSTTLDVSLTEDDVTVLLVRANGNKPRPRFRDFLWANIRFVGSLIRAINPWAERPPLPDLNVANIGGAIIPALEQRWRATGSLRRPNP